MLKGVNYQIEIEQHRVAQIVQHKGEHMKGNTFDKSSKHNEKYMRGSGMEGKVMGHDKKPYYVDPMPRRDMGKIKEIPSYYSNTPKEAFDYNY